MTTTKPFEASFRTIPQTDDWFRPEELFLDRVTVQEPAGACPAALAVPGEETFTENDLTPILPITQRLLACFTPEALAERLTLVMQGSGVTLTFRYPVKTAGGTEERTFEKTYRDGENILLLDNRLPSARLRADGDGYELACKNRADGEAPVKNCLYLSPWTSGQESTEPILKNAYTTRLAARPEALLCTAVPLGEKDPKPAYLGAILLQETATGELFRG